MIAVESRPLDETAKVEVATPPYREAARSDWFLVRGEYRPIGGVAYACVEFSD